MNLTLELTETELKNLATATMHCDDESTTKKLLKHDTITYEDIQNIFVGLVRGYTVFCKETGTTPDYECF